MPRLGSDTPCTSHRSPATHKPNQLPRGAAPRDSETRSDRTRDEPGYSVGEHSTRHRRSPLPRYAEYSNGVLSGGLYRGPRTSSLRNKAVCKDAVCSFVYRRARSHHLTTAMPPSTGPPQPIQLDSLRGSPCKQNSGEAVVHRRDATDRTRPMLLKKSLENGRLLAMLRPGCSRGRRGNDGTTTWWSQATVLFVQSR